jgi:ASC-1-like (ASCH) protein
MMHEIKIWPEYMQAIVDGRKTYELRRLERRYKVGDTLLIREYDTENKLLTGRELTLEITGVNILPRYDCTAERQPVTPFPIYAHDNVDWALISFRAKEA